jgi:hypothetical protein
MPAPADKIILSSMFLTLGSTTAASMLPESMGGNGELPKPRMLIAGALTFSALSMLSDFAPGLAGPLALVIGLSAAAYYAVPILDKTFTDKG